MASADVPAADQLAAENEKGIAEGL